MSNVNRRFRRGAALAWWLVGVALLPAPAVLAQEAEPAPAEQGEADEQAAEEFVPRYDLGDNTLSIRLGVGFPLFLLASEPVETYQGERKSVLAPNLSLMGSGAVNWNTYLNPWFTIGMEVSGALAVDINDALLYQVPILVRGGYVIGLPQMEIPLMLGLGRRGDAAGGQDQRGVRAAAGGVVPVARHPGLVLRRHRRVLVHLGAAVGGRGGQPAHVRQLRDRDRHRGVSLLVGALRARRRGSPAVGAALVAVAAVVSLALAGCEGKGIYYDLATEEPRENRDLNDQLTVNSVVSAGGHYYVAAGGTWRRGHGQTNWRQVARPQAGGKELGVRGLAAAGNTLCAGTDQGLFYAAAGERPSWQGAAGVGRTEQVQRVFAVPGSPNGTPLLAFTTTELKADAHAYKVYRM